MKYRISYEYVNPCRAGPFRGKAIVDQMEKPTKGDCIIAMMGRAIIKTVSKAKEQS